jgi:hypothetical protein
VDLGSLQRLKSWFALLCFFPHKKIEQTLFNFRKCHLS